MYVRSLEAVQVALRIAGIVSWSHLVATDEVSFSDDIVDLLETDRSSVGATFEALLKIIHQQDRSTFETGYWNSVKSGKTFRLQARLQTAKGRVKWIDVRSQTQFAGSGEAICSIGTMQDITEHRAREIELQRFRHLVEQAPMEIWLADENHRLVYANRAAASSIGTTQDRLIGVHLADIDADGEVNVTQVKERIEGHRFTERPPQVFRIHHLAADGRLIPKEMYATVREIDGRSHGIAFARDITEELRARRILAEGEALLRATLDTYPGWVACVDVEMRFVYVNSQFARVVGRPAEEIVGRAADDVLGEHDAEDRKAIHQRLLGGEVSISVEQRFLDCAGREHIAWVEYRRADGTAAMRSPLFFTFVTDVTELRHTQQRLAAVTQDMGVGFWEWTHPTGALDFNDELLRLVGCTRADIDGDPLAWLAERIDPADRTGRDRTVLSLVTGELSRAQVQMRVRHKNGHSVWVQEMLRIVHRDEADGSVRVIGVAQDISELKAREAELETLAQQLEARIAARTQALEDARQEAVRANAAKSEFLSQMSHEFRTPLNAILGFGQLLEASELLNDSREHVDEIARAGRQLLQLIDEVLDLASVEAGRARVKMEAVRLHPLVTDCVRQLLPMARTAGVQIEIADDFRDAIVCADSGRLRQVLLNVLSNAVKYNRLGGRVLVSTWSDDEALLEVRVADTGVGLSADQIGRLFQPFERLDAASSGVQGTGIGLALSRRLMGLMGGRMTVESQPGKGSCFALQLNRADRVTPASSSMDWLQLSVQPSSVPSGARAHRLLYVEDNAANQRLMVSFLKLCRDVELRVASSMAEALLAAPQFVPDLLLIDVQLPDGDGFALLSALRAQSVMAPAVAVSANAMPADIARGKAAGFAEYLTKPLDLARLRQVIESLR